VYFPAASLAALGGAQDSLDKDPAGETEVEAVLCTAVKIEPNVFLTAAHCVLNVQGISNVEGVEGVSVRSPVGIAVSQVSFLDEKNLNHQSVRPLKIKRLFVAKDYLTYGQGAGRLSDLFDHLDLALIEVEDGMSDIPVASLSPFPMKRDYAIDVGGYGNTIVPEIPVIEEPFASYPSHLRWDVRRIQLVKEKMITLRSKPLGVTMTPVNPINRSMMRKIKNARVNNGDSGGPAWVKSSDGKTYVAAINCLFRPKIPLFDFMRKANTVEYLVRVDVGSPGYTWVTSVVNEIKENKLPVNAVFVR
jgi:hypothetical protein